MRNNGIMIKNMDFGFKNIMDKFMKDNGIKIVRVIYGKLIQNIGNKSEGNLKKERKEGKDKSE